ncbi:hypothetical protein Taro_013533 [Colocasia esculenta]|uniref:Uncharacterized protein n=1 Tax=Colocasia esculenta TaxID=4460 RepID=A0A843UJ18_COLES|nr:hypothetical protein [Colocasia esculenta]
MIMELGARRRWPFRREGPNGLALLLEHAPLPLVVCCIGFGVVFGRFVPEPLSAENATCIEVVMMSRQAGLPRHHRDGLMRRDLSKDSLGRQQQKVSLQYLPQQYWSSR